MDTLDIFSAGAAQAVVARLARSFQLDSKDLFNASYGAVHSLKSRILAGESVDVIVLTDALINELIGKSLVVAGSRVDLGTVGTGLAVHANMPLPAVASLPMLRATLLASEKLSVPTLRRQPRGGFCSRFWSNWALGNRCVRVCSIAPAATKRWPNWRAARACAN